MKKFLSIFLLVGFCVASANLSIEKTIREDQGINIKVINTIPSGVDGLNITILEQPNGFRTPVFSTKDGKTIIGIPELLISGNEKFKNTLQKTYTEVENYNDKITEKGVLAVFKQFDAEVVKLQGGDPSKITYMVVDANCPYCYQEIQKLDETLKNSNVHMLVVGALNMDSMKKAASFYDELKSKKTQQDKIALLKAVFEKSYKPKEGIDTSVMLDISMELSKAGMSAVPYIIRK